MQKVWTFILISSINKRIDILIYDFLKKAQWSTQCQGNTPINTKE